MACGKCKRKKTKEMQYWEEQKAKLNDLVAQFRSQVDWQVWDGQLKHKTPPRQYSVSVCTTCMNRLVDLRQTLPKNIDDNSDYPAVEFVLLDYNSKDGLGEWVQKELGNHIESGKLKYFRTEDPEFYSMTHSRNLAFKLASGAIVNNVDADNFTNPGFATKINELANQKPNYAIFAKGKRMLRGRLGFWKHEFIDLLGGYDEEIKDYGHDDWDLINRAYMMGFMLMWWGGQHYGNCGSKKHQTGNMKNPKWKETELRNKIISYEKIIDGKLKANIGKEWGKANIIKNFKDRFVI